MPYRQPQLLDAIPCPAETQLKTMVPCFVWCPVQHVQRLKPPGMACLNSWWSARGEMVWSNEGPHLLTVVWKFGGLVGVAVYMTCGGVISIAAL